MPSVSLVSINIERSKHLDLVVPFLKERNAEVVCIQECMERDVPFLEDATGGKCFYTPQCIFGPRPDEVQGVYGQGIFSRLSFSFTRAVQYAGEELPTDVFHKDDKLEDIIRVARVLSSVGVEKDGADFRIATTHFTWSEKGEASELQRRDLIALFSRLDDLGEFVLCGDFNAPRGRATFDTIAARYKDNIPAQYTTSIDPKLHRAGALPYMVDGLFTTRGYTAEHVELHSGISDHMGISATIHKKI